MAERAHTPGPWRWMGSALVGNHGHRPVVIAADRNGTIVTRQEDGRLGVMASDHPNALVIKASPQLLDSLLAVEWGGFTEDDRGDLVDACPSCLSPIGDPEIEGSGLHTPTCQLRDSLDAALGVKSPRAEVAHG